MKVLEKFLILICLTVLSVGATAIESTFNLVHLIQPSTVQIVHTVEGTIDLPNFVFDYDKDTIASTTKSDDFITVSISTTTQATGFIVSADGVIVTNSEVVNASVLNIYQKATEKYLKSISKGEDDLGYHAAYQTIFNYLKENSVKDLSEDIKVLKSENKNHQAKIIYSNLSFENNHKDIALLKIEANTLPAIPLADYTIQVGQEVYSLSYPLLDGSIAEPVFNRALINTKSGTLYQSNIPSIDGAIGSPVVGSDGKLAGTLTLGGLIIPSDQIKNTLATAGVVIKTSPYSEQYLAGLRYMESSRCVKAIEEFNKAKKVNPDFSVDEFVQPKIDICNSLIQSGKSRDGWINEIIFMFRGNEFNINLWTTIGALFVLMIIFFKYLINRFRRDEQYIGLNKVNTKDSGSVIAKKSNTKSKRVSTEEFAVTNPFEPFDTETLVTPKAKVKIKAPEKVTIKQRPEPAAAPVKAPKAIQPDGPLVVIAPFKTLSSPITSRPKKTTELQKDIKTDLPSQKKEGLTL